MQQSKYVSTRYIDEERIGYIFYGISASKKKQKITEFHDQMKAVKYLRIDDLIIGKYFAPNSTHINRLICKATELDVAYHLGQQLKLQQTKWKTEELCVVRLFLHHIKNKYAAVEDCLRSIRSLQYGINQRKLDDILAKYDDWDGLPQKRDDILILDREIKLSKRLRANMTNRTERIDCFTKEVANFRDRMNAAKTSDWKIVCGEVVTLYAKMKDELEKHAADLHMHSIKQVAQFEYHEMLKMYCRLKYHEQDLPTHIQNCDYGLAMNKTKKRIFDLKWFEQNEKVKTYIKNLYIMADNYLETLQTKLRPLQNLHNQWKEDRYEA